MMITMNQLLQYKPLRLVISYTYLVWTWIQLYILGMIYLAKEIDRKLGWFSTVRKLDYERDLPRSLNGLTAIITGGTRGIGLQTTKTLVSRGCHVIVASSSDPKKFDSMISNVMKDIKSQASKARNNNNSGDSKEARSIGKLDIWHLDLFSMESVNKFVDKFLATRPQLNLLINNAGIMFAPEKRTRDGIESHFQVNYLGHCLLIWRLLPILNKTGLNSPHKSRIVNVSSSTHFARNIRWHDLQSELLYSPYHCYAQSKIAQIMYTYKLHQYLTENEKTLGGVTVNSLHPGVILTDLYEYVWWTKAAPFLGKILFRSIEEGAETTLYAALSTEMEGVGGKYLEDCAIHRSSRFSKDQNHQDELWKVTWRLLDQWLAPNDFPNPLRQTTK